MNILCATDNNYAPYCGIMLTSVLENNTDVDIYVLISSRLSDINKRRFGHLEEKYGTYIHFVQINSAIFDNFPMGLELWPKEMFYRLLAPEILPKTLHRIIYLDCDIIVRCNLDELWSLEMDNVSALVVPECNAFKYSDRLSLNSKYFCSGMFVINLDYWREHNISQQLLDYLTNNRERILYPDQDALNVVLSNTKREIDLKYQFNIFDLTEENFYALPTKEKAHILATVPQIIHYSTGWSIRPWDIRYYKMPLAKVWNYYKRISPWRWLAHKYPEKKKIQYFIKRYFLWPLGIKRITNIYIPQAINIK